MILATKTMVNDQRLKIQEDTVTENFPQIFIKLLVSNC